METRVDERKFAVIGLTVFGIDKVVVSLINLSGVPRIIWGIYVFNLTTIIFNWLVPLIIVFWIERRGLGSLGLSIEPRRRYPYLALAFFGFVLPSFFTGFSREIVLEFLEQLAFIGLAEEFFFRGYLMERFCEWLGDLRGLLLNATIFSLGHLIFLLTRYNLTLVWGDLLVGLQTFMGGLLLGYIYLRAGDIVPGSIFHISLNVYLSRL